MTDPNPNWPPEYGSSLADDGLCSQCRRRDYTQDDGLCDACRNCGLPTMEDVAAFAGFRPKRDWTAQDDSLSPFEAPGEKKTCSDKTESPV